MSYVSQIPIRSAIVLHCSFYLLVLSSLCMFRWVVLYLLWMLICSIVNDYIYMERDFNLLACFGWINVSLFLLLFGNEINKIQNNSNTQYTSLSNWCSSFNYVNRQQMIKKKEINSIKKYDIISKIRYFRTVWEFSKKLNSTIQNADDLGNIFTNKIHIDI